MLPREEVAAWSAQEGKPKADRVETKQRAYERRIELRKTGPARAAVIRSADGFVIEAERLIGPFRYLPQPAPIRLPLDCSAADLGRAIRAALARFEMAAGAHTAMLGPIFAGESERLLELGIADEHLDCVRYLGYEIAFRVEVAAAECCVSITCHDGVLELWPDHPVGDGRFSESDWRHQPLGSGVSVERLGAAVLAATQHV